MPSSGCRPTALTAALLLLLVLGCGDDPADPTDDPPTASQVALISANDSILAQGGSSQLTATARDAAGGTVAVTQFNWSTSNGTAIAVGAAGLATAQQAGTAVITATVPGTSVSGTIRLRAVAADLTAVTALQADAYAIALVGALTTTTRATVQPAWTLCSTGAGAGNIVAIRSCVTAVRAAATAATDPTDRSLLAVLVLFADLIEQRLNL